MDSFEAQKQIEQAYKDGYRDAHNKTLLLKQFILGETKNWTIEQWNIFDEIMETFNIK